MAIPQGRIDHAKWPFFLPPLLAPHFLPLNSRSQQLHVSDIGADFALERNGLDTLVCQRRGQLRGRKVHPHTHVGIGLLDHRVRHLDETPARLVQSQRLAAQFVDHLLAQGRLVRCQLIEPSALVDVVRGDRLAIDGDVLRRRDARARDPRDDNTSRREHASRHVHPPANRRTDCSPAAWRLRGVQERAMIDPLTPPLRPPRAP
jgi:hypothetical protein